MSIIPCVISALIIARWQEWGLYYSNDPERMFRAAAFFPGVYLLFVGTMILPRGLRSRLPVSLINDLRAIPNGLSIAQQRLISGLTREWLALIRYPLLTFVLLYVLCSVFSGYHIMAIFVPRTGFTTFVDRAANPQKLILMFTGLWTVIPLLDAFYVRFLGRHSGVFIPIVCFLVGGALLAPYSKLIFILSSLISRRIGYDAWYDEVIAIGITTGLLIALGIICNCIVWRIVLKHMLKPLD